jgi:hypothetical protein
MVIIEELGEKYATLWKQTGGVQLHKGNGQLQNTAEKMGLRM